MKHFKYKDTDGLKERVWKMICHVNRIRKKRRVSHKDYHFIMMKESIQWSDITILKLYITKIRDSRCVKQNIDRT